MTPAYRFKSNGKEFTDMLDRALISLSIKDRSGTKNDTLELTLDDSDGRIQEPRKGAEFLFYLGYRETGVEHMGLFVVDEVEYSYPPMRMRVRAQGGNVAESVTVSGMKDRLKSQTTRSWHNTTLGQIVGGIAASSGYIAVVGAKYYSMAIAHLDQTDESDMNLLTRLATQYDAIFKPRGAKLFFVERGTRLEDEDGNLVPRVTVYGPTLKSPLKCRLSDFRYAQLVSMDFARSESGNYNRVRAFYHDHGAGQRVAVDAGSGEPIKTLNDPFPNYEEASRAALAELARIQRGNSNGRLTLVGNPWLRADCILELDGFREAMNGEWKIVEAVHRLGDSGYTTDVQFEAFQSK